MFTSYVFKDIVVTGRQRGELSSLSTIFLPRGSLDAWIFPHAGGPTNVYLSWKLRYEAAIDVSKALTYLHQYCCPPILHFDIKPENILIDEKFRIVLSDFGFSEFKSEDDGRVIRTEIRGTAGYRAPEWLTSTGISEKTDMFSYGKVLLDLFFGQRLVCLD
ncbi:hypothetical protein GIB67_029113 [Kingdonia uniflora]|uniref:Protein kinase domain-containing protein n=1 Tax=Kingdonia uniflora TaxID=39325 RepID=A0A7J7N743_9MAGN|nr:hypothetical protein GIB67_029113 [Kingdonia uniflora]